MFTKYPLHRHYYAFIDGFRALAILMVLLHHARRGFDLDHLFANSVIILNWIYFRAQEYLGLDLTSFYFFLQNLAVKIKGILGIEIFFVISGFLICKILLKEGLQRVDVWGFYLRRFFKIYPSYALMVIVSLFIYSFQEGVSVNVLWEHLLTHLLLLQNYFPQVSLLGHTWSMVIIEQFYIFCPLVMLVTLALFKHVAHRRIVLMIICFLLIAIAPLMRVYYLLNNQTLITGPLTSPIPYWTTFYHVDALAVGCLLAFVEPDLAPVLNNRIQLWGMWFVGFAVFFWLFFGVEWSYYWGEWYLYSLGLIGFILLFLAAYKGVGTLTRLSWVQWVGRHSYGIYIWHYLILVFWKQFLGKWPITLLVVFYLISAIGVGVLSTQTFESFFLQLRERFMPNGKKSIKV